MALSFCRNCDSAFFYDDGAGVNVKFYEAESNARCFQTSGVYPICPDCEAKCQTEWAINFDKSQIKFETRFILKHKTRALTGNNVSEQDSTD